MLHASAMCVTGVCYAFIMCVMCDMRVLYVSCVMCEAYVMCVTCICNVSKERRLRAVYFDWDASYWVYNFVQQETPGYFHVKD